MRSLIDTFLLMIAVWMAPAADAQTKLDAPVSTQPTVRSEIKRGESIAFNCGLHATIDYDAFTSCVNDAIDANEQKRAKSDPFVLGVSIGAIAQAGIIKPSEQAGFVMVWRQDAASIIKKYKFSAADLCGAFGMKCEVVKGIVQQLPVVR